MWYAWRLSINFLFLPWHDFIVVVFTCIKSCSVVYDKLQFTDNIMFLYCILCDLRVKCMKLRHIWKVVSAHLHVITSKLSRFWWNLVLVSTLKLPSTFNFHLCQSDIYPYFTWSLNQILSVFWKLFQSYKKFVLTHSLTHSVEQDIIWKARSHSACWQISCFLYGTRRFITVFTKAYHWTQSWASWIHLAPSIPITLRYILMLSSHPPLGLPNGLLPSGLPTKTL